MLKLDPGYERLQQPLLVACHSTLQYGCCIRGLLKNVLEVLHIVAGVWEGILDAVLIRQEPKYFVTDHPL